MYPDYYFFTNAFTCLLQRELKSRQTSSIFTNQSEAGLAILHKLRTSLIPVINQYIDTMAQESRQFVAKNLHESFSEYPKLLVVTQDIVDNIMEKQENMTEKNVQDLLDLEEKSTNTNSTYYKHLVSTLFDLLIVKPEEVVDMKESKSSVDIQHQHEKQLQQQLTKSEKQQTPIQKPLETPTEPIPLMSENKSVMISSEFEFIKPKIHKLRQMQRNGPNKQLLIGLQIELFAYWKVMTLRLNDLIIMLSRNYILRKPFENLIIWQLQSELMEGDLKLLDLMKFDNRRMNNIEEKKKRLKRLQRAQNSLIRAHSKRLEVEEVAGSNN